MTHAADYIIIWSWIAWLSASLFASKKWSVILISKNEDLRWWSSFLAQWWIAASQNTELHFQDTMKASHNTSNPEVVRFFVENAWDAYLWLKDEIKVPFIQEPALEWWHSERRVWTAWDDSGKVIVNCLIDKIKENRNIKIFSWYKIEKLIVEWNKIIWASWIQNWNQINFHWKKILLATWWIWQKFKTTTNPLSITGDWIELAKQVWAKIEHLDWIQWHPTCLNVDENPVPLISETLRWEWAMIVNQKWERFLEKYHKDLELAPRDVISQAILDEEKKWNKAFISLKNKPKQFWLKRFPNITWVISSHWFDIWKDLIPIKPWEHFLCWGIKVNKKWKTSIPWLYAIWEVSFTGLHGKNRLPSNSLTECIVWAKSFGE